MISGLFEFLRENPPIVLFAALAGGYALGKVKFGKSFSLGSTTSVLLIAIVLGAIIFRGHDDLDLGLIKTVSFGFFIFAIGYKVGPDFIGGLKRGGVKYVTVAVFFCVVALISAVFLARAFGLNAGYAGGLMGGALTQSAIIGTADGALQHLATGKTASILSSVINLKSDVAVAYAVTYIFGTAGLIILLKVIGKVWRIDLPAEAQKAQAELGAAEAQDTLEAFHWSNLIVPRAYQIENPEVIGKTVKEIEDSFQKSGLHDAYHDAYVSIVKIKRGDKVIVDVPGDMKLDKGDVIIITGRRSSLFDSWEDFGPEISDSVIEEMIGEILPICLTNKDLDGKTFDEIFTDYGHGCFVRSITRQGHELPLGPKLKIYRGDIINVIGDRSDVEELIKVIGYPERQTNITDLVTVGIGLILGTLIGLVAIKVGGVPITLGVGGGVLISGLFFGWLRSVKPTFGLIPTATVWIFTDLGLNFFIACVGIAAGPRALDALRTAGINIFLAGVCLTSIPHILTWIFGLYAIKLNPVLLLGAMTGAGTCTAAMNSVKEDAKSAVPVIGYTVPYAIGNVLLTVWGALIVSLV
ncbi:MAG: TrkA C-terminal domain-containing protein [Candidatus Euphemobacter frigidus]|nr:TrkA C-terminal domain-containing protein [Candidatus Euphemobacter frigidus]MDP8276131.1 TrkA C-terminal domain-containing protein [Candidatus Euphemobacter frigidus]